MAHKVVDWWCYDCYPTTSETWACEGFGLGTHLFVKVSQPGDSEGTFRSSSQASDTLGIINSQATPQSLD